MSSVKTNYAYNLINTLAGLLFPLITFPYAARILLPEGIGQVQFFTSIITYISLFTSIGIPLYAVREIARVKDDAAKMSRTAVEILLLHTGLTLLGYLLVAGLCLGIGELRENAGLFLLLSTQLIFTVIGCEWFYQGIEEFRYITIRSLIVKIVAAACLFIFVRSREDLMLYAGYTIVGTVGNNVFNFIRLRKHIIGKISGLQIGRHVKPALKIFVLNLITSIYVNLDTVMLGFISGATAVGYYTGATKLTRMLLGVVTALGTVMIPKMSHLFAAGDVEAFNRLSAKSLRFINFLSLPMTAGLAILAPSLIFIFCGPEYAPAATTLRLISPIILFISLSNVIGIQILYPQGKEKLVIISTLVGACLNFALNLALIPRWQQDGAAFASSVAELSVTATQILIARKFIPAPVISGCYSNYYIGTIIMAAACLGLMAIDLNNILKIIIIPLCGAMIYGLWLLLRKDSLMLEVVNALKPNRNETV